jgi:glucuronate isomerase
MLNPDRYFSPFQEIRNIAITLFEQVAAQPIVSPHTHVDPHLFSDPVATFGSPADLFIIPDHYVMRILYSQGIPLENLGAPRLDGGTFEIDHRVIWRLFCTNFYLFHGTPSGIWLMHELSEVFGIDEKPSAINADQLYDTISDKLTSPDFSPRKLFERFNIEILATTDAATDTLEYHRAIQNSSWCGGIIPTFRPDAVIDLDSPNWRANIDKLRVVSGIDIVDYLSYLRALEQRREYFKSMGATATDHSPQTPATAELTTIEANAIFQRALYKRSIPDDASRFTANMLMEMARMSADDGLVMQLRPGLYRNHNEFILRRFGPDKGCDIPVQTEYTRNLLPLLNKYGNDHNLTLIVFTLDETTYSRELSTLAGHYPALKLGSPWWFHDSLNGIARYFDQVMETAGLYNTAGFNDDARAFCSIPARHDVWRRSSANWIAGMVARHIIDMTDAQNMMKDLAVGLARRTYKVDKGEEETL